MNTMNNINMINNQMMNMIHMNNGLGFNRTNNSNNSNVSNNFNVPMNGINRQQLINAPKPKYFSHGNISQFYNNGNINGFKSNQNLFNNDSVNGYSSNGSFNSNRIDVIHNNCNKMRKNSSGGLRNSSNDSYNSNNSNNSYNYNLSLNTSINSGNGQNKGPLDLIIKPRKNLSSGNLSSLVKSDKKRSLFNDNKKKDEVDEVDLSTMLDNLNGKVAQFICSQKGSR